MGNTVVVVEHDEDTMRAADHIVDFGPGPGVRGGEVVATGTADQIAARQAQPHGAISGRQAADRSARHDAAAEARRCCESSAPGTTICKNVDVEIPLGALVCVTGVSGSGKSSLVNDILVEALRRDLNGGVGEPGEHDRIEGLEHLDKLIAIDQSPIGRTPRSNPATYIKVFDEIRDLYTQLPESKTRGYKAGPVQLQRQRRPLRGLRRERLEPAGDGFSGRRVGHLPGVRRASLQPRDAASSLQGQDRSPTCWKWTCSRRSSISKTFPKCGTSCKRCTTWASIISSSASPRPRFPAARPSGSSWPASW